MSTIYDTIFYDMLRCNSKISCALWLFNIAMETMAETDDFPSYKAPFSSWIFHSYVSHNQMVYLVYDSCWFQPPGWSIPIDTAMVSSKHVKTLSPNKITGISGCVFPKTTRISGISWVTWPIPRIFFSDWNHGFLFEFARLDTFQVSEQLSSCVCFFLNGVAGIQHRHFNHP